MGLTILFGVLGSALAAASSSAIASSGTAAVVRVSEIEPFTVSGRHFRPGEQVQIVVQAKGRFEAQQAAGPDGSFTAVIPEVKFDECKGYVVKAEGSLGSRAAFKRQAAECGVPLAEWRAQRENRWSR
jgi:hypothetical protein